MKRLMGIFALALAMNAQAGCLHVLDDAPTTIAEFRDNGVPVANVKKMMAQNYSPSDEKPYALAMVDAIYGSKVKPWDAQLSVANMCNRQQATAAPDPRDPRNAAGFDRLPPQIKTRAIQQYQASQGNGPVVPNPKCPNGARMLGGGLYDCVKSPEQVAADEAAAEKQREISYKDSFNRMPNIPGICVGEACNHIRKIQHWDAQGDMTN